MAFRTIRLFPRKTKATPDDQDVVINRGPGFFDECDSVEISVSFTWDIPVADKLEKQWKYVAPVKIGGPALGAKGEDFVPGRYVKNGYVITSRGCPNNCWFCSVPKREGPLRELPVTNGWNVLDDNLLACSDMHINRVFDMLAKQKQKPEFTGGLEAARLKRWHVDRILFLKPSQMFFAYDTPDDFEPLVQAAKMFYESGLSKKSHALRAYVLIGWPKDTFDAAEKRLNDTLKLGVTPMAMLYRNTSGETQRDWRKLQRMWARPAIIYARRPI